jgi:hypothetical protein
MGWLQRIIGLAESPPLTTGTGMVQSPWSDPGNLTKVVLEDIVGAVEGIQVLTRSQAMMVPAVQRARGLVAGTLSRYPLKAYKGDDELPEQPAWLYRTDTDVPPRQRLLWTLDDLIFYGHALWVVSRGAQGQILDAARAPIQRWSLNDKGGIDFEEAPGRKRTLARSEYIYFRSPQDALLSAGALAVRTALAVQKGTSARAASPVPLINLELTDDWDRDEDELKRVQANWATARASENGAVAVTPVGIKAVEMGKAGADYMESARNASRIDIANIVGIPASELDGSLETSTLTYTTTEGNRNRLHDGLEMWRTAIEDRLSMDDVVPRGQRVGIDVTALISRRDGDDPALAD